MHLGREKKRKAIKAAAHHFHSFHRVSDVFFLLLGGFFNARRPIYPSTASERNDCVPNFVSQGKKKKGRGLKRSQMKHDVQPDTR